MLSRQTFERRRTPVPDDVPSGLSDELSDSPEKQARWRAFASRGGFSEQPSSLHEVVAMARELLMPVAGALQNAQTLEAIWDPGGPWRPA